MKRSAAVLLSVLVLNGCASAPKSAPTAAASPSVEAPPPAPPEAAATAPEEPTQSAAEAWAEKKSRAEESASPTVRDGASADPLAVGGAMESASTTKIELTSKRELRPKTRRDLDDGQALAEKAATFDEAVQKLNARLGKPTWVENGKKRVWVVNDGPQCHRLVLDVDGSVDTETASATEWRMLSALSQQNACTGAVQNGVPGMKAP